MQELHLGFMPDEEMAEWCGKDLKSFKKNKSRWASTRLSKFAEFEIIRGKGFNINKIIEPIYSPNAKKEVAEKWQPYWGYNGNHLDSNKDCWKKLKPYMTNKISDKTGANYICKEKCELYGSARTGHKHEGIRGHCKYTYCVIIKNIPQYFDQEDYQIKAKLEKQYLDPTYIDQKYKMRALYSEYKRGEISQEEYEESLNILVELDLGWLAFEEAFTKYLKEKYGETAYADFRQELVERAWKVEITEGNFEF